MHPPSSLIERRKPSTDFNLQRMEAIYEQARGKTDVLHRHDYYTVILVEKAEGSHLVDSQTYEFRPMEVYFISPGQVHQVALSAPPKGWALTFSRDFLVENNISESFISNINLFKGFGDTPPLKLDEITFDRLVRILGEMESCMPDGLTYRERALGALLQLFLIYCNNSSSLNSSQLDEENPGVCILRDFKRMVESHYSEWHKVQEYAEAIHITSKHLSQTVKNITGKSAKELIQDRLVLEAKRLLLHTNSPVKEVAYTLGFEEPLHFSGFFKRNVGISPSDYKVRRSNF